MSQAAIFLVNALFLSTKLVDPIRSAAEFSQADEVVQTTNRLCQTILANWRIVLTWLNINTESGIDILMVNKSNAGGAINPSALSKELRILIFERMPNSDWSSQFSTLFGTTSFDPSLLEGQILPQSTTMSTNDHQLEDAVDKKDDIVVHDLNFDIRSLKQLPKDTRKHLVRVLRLAELSSWNELPDQEVVAKSLHVIAESFEDCVSTYYQIGAVHRALTVGIRLDRHLAQASTDVGSSVIKPKRLINSAIAQLPRILLPKADTTTTDEQVDHQSDGDEEERLANGDSSSKLVDEYTQECFVNLLIELATSVPKVFVKKVPVLRLLVAYSATLSDLDRSIVKLLFIMETHSPGLLAQSNCYSVTPLIWGSRACDNYIFPVDSHKRSSKLNTPSTRIQPTLQTLFNLFEVDYSDNLLLESAIKFPVKRKWLGLRSKSTPDFDNSTTKLLDPCFALFAIYSYLQYYRLLQSGANLPLSGASLDTFLRSFLTHNCLAYAIAGLAAYSTQLRSVARSIVAIYHQLAVAWKPSGKNRSAQPASNTVDSHFGQALQLFPERTQVLFLLQAIRNSLATGGGFDLGGGHRKPWMLASPVDNAGRLTRLHATFFVKALHLLTRPDNHMYSVVWNCLLAKPAIDLSQVPDFLRLFFSTNNQFRIERQWICRLCADSFTDASEYIVLERSRVIKHMLVTYSASSSDSNFQMSVLQLLVAITSQSRFVHSLIRFHAFTVWLWRHSLHSSTPHQNRLFVKLIDNVLDAVDQKPEHQATADLVRLLKDQFDSSCQLTRNVTLT